MLDDLGYPYDIGHPKIGVLKLATSLVRPYTIRFFLFIFLQPHGHVPKHNHLSLSLALVLSKTMFQKALRKFGESK